MTYIGKWLIFMGLAVAVVGLILWGGAKIGTPVGKLPGDIAIKKERFSLYFPIVTSIVISIILTIIINLVIWIARK